MFGMAASVHDDEPVFAAKNHRVAVGLPARFEATANQYDVRCQVRDAPLNSARSRQRHDGRDE